MQHNHWLHSEKKSRDGYLSRLLSPTCHPNTRIHFFPLENEGWISKLLAFEVERNFAFIHCIQVSAFSSAEHGGSSLVSFGIFISPGNLLPRPANTENFLTFLYWPVMQVMISPTWAWSTSTHTSTLPKILSVFPYHLKDKISIFRTTSKAFMMDPHG